MTREQSTFAYIAWDVCQDRFRHVGDVGTGAPIACAKVMHRMSEDIFPVLPADTPWEAIKKAEAMAPALYARDPEFRGGVNLWTDPDALEFVAAVKEITPYLNKLITDAEWGLETKSQGPPVWKIPLMMGLPNQVTAALFILPGVACATCSTMALLGRVYVLAVLLVNACLLAWAWLISWLVMYAVREHTDNYLNFEDNIVGPDLRSDGRPSSLPTPKY